MNNLELIDTLIKEKKTSIDVHKSILETDNSRRWFHNKMIKECEEHIEILFKIKSELEEYQKLKDKETPKKIIRYSGTSYDYNEVDFFTCPNCRNLYKGQKYCDVCGQALSSEIYDGEVDEDRSDD